jgi:hypothetical protein
MTEGIDPCRAVEFLNRNFAHVSVMAFPKNAGCLHPGETGPEAACKFIAAHPDEDIYFVIGNRGDPSRPGKPRKEDMVGSKWAWGDFDPPRGMENDPAALGRWGTDKLGELDRSGLPQPHVIVNSGRGIWLFWRLSRTIDAEESEAINRAIAQKLGGDSCHNIDRVARLPFTKNSKTSAIASIVREVEGEVAPEALPHAAPAAADARTAQVELEVGTAIGSLDELDRWNVDARLLRIVEHGRDPENPKQGDDSRSTWVWDCVLGLRRHGVPEETILAMLLDRRCRIS